MKRILLIGILVLTFASFLCDSYRTSKLNRDYKKIIFAFDAYANSFDELPSTMSEIIEFMNHNGIIYSENNIFLNKEIAKIRVQNFEYIILGEDRNKLHYFPKETTIPMFFNRVLRNNTPILFFYVKVKTEPEFESIP